MTADVFIESRHRRWLEAFVDAERLQRRPPSMREYMQVAYVGSPSVAAYRLAALVERGYIEVVGTRGESRSRRITTKGLQALGMAPAPGDGGQQWQTS